MILELKARKAGIAAVKQIRRYLTDFENKGDKNDRAWSCNGKTFGQKLSW